MGARGLGGGEDMYVWVEKKALGEGEGENRCVGGEGVTM